MEERVKPRVVRDDAERALLRAMRDTRSDRSPRERRAAAAFVVAIHLALILVLHSALVVEPEVRPAPVDEQVMVVEFVEAEETAPPPPDVAPPSVRPAIPVAADPADMRPAPRTKAEPPRMTARFIERTEPVADAPPPKPLPRLLNRDGSLRLSQEVIDAAAEEKPAPGYVEKDMSQPEMMVHRSPVDYRATRFDKYWVPDQETLGQELVRKYPALGLVLQGVNAVDRCPPRSIDPECEGEAQPAFNDDPFPDEDLVD